MNLSQEQYIDMYLKTQRVREFDVCINKLTRHGLVQDVTHFSVRGGAASTGVMAHLTYDDIIFSNHRGHGQCTARNMDLNKTMVELADKVTGVSKGRDNSIYLTDFGKGNYSTDSIIGGGYALAAGVALTQRYQKTDDIVVAFSGDGATNEDSFHESVNLAAIQGPSVISFIIDNRYDISMDITRATSTSHLYTWAEAYGTPGFYCEDNNDVLAVHETMGKTVGHVRSGDNPAVVEIESYHWFGHSIAGADKYHSKEEVDDWRERDPFIKFRTYLAENYLASRDELDAINARVVKEVGNTYVLVQNSPKPDLSVAFEDVWVDQTAFQPQEKRDNDWNRANSITQSC